MSETKKPRADSVLKTLPEARQAAIVEYARTHTLAETVAWLSADGLKTSAAALSLFLSSYRVQDRLTRNANTVRQVLADMKQDDPSLSDAQLDRAGQRFFTALAIAEEDSLAWKRAQDAKAKLGLLELTREKFQRDFIERFIEWFKDKQAAEILNSNAPTADKTEKLGQRIFGDLWQ